MPASRSPSRETKVSRPFISYRLLILVGIAAVLAVIVAVLPASLVARFLPPAIHAEDFSGNVWHGSAGKITVNGKNAGALEWQLHPLPLLSLTASLDLHWVNLGFVIDGAVNLAHERFSAHDIQGAGPIEDLRDFGIAPGWRGIANIRLSKLDGDFTGPKSAVGEIEVSDLTSRQVAEGADLGGYLLKLGENALGADGSVGSQLSDTGGPLEVQALIHVSAKDRTGTLTGTLKERAEAPPALRSELANLAQLRPRDSQGRIPVDLEFTL